MELSSTFQTREKQQIRWSVEALERNRRKRRARRLFRDFSLFAVELMQERYPDYNTDQLWQDLPLKKKAKKRRGKRNLSGKASYLEELKFKIKNIVRSDRELDNNLLARYMILEERKGEPWQIQVHFKENGSTVYSFSTLYQVEQLREFRELAKFYCSLPDGKQKLDEYFAKMKPQRSTF